MGDAKMAMSAAATSAVSRDSSVADESNRLGACSLRSTTGGRRCRERDPGDRARKSGGQGTGHRKGGTVNRGRWLRVAGGHGYSHDVDLRIRLSWRWGWYPGPFGQNRFTMRRPA